MWAVYLITSPHSIYYNHHNKEDVIAKDFLKNPKFKWSSLKEVIDFYKNGVLSIAEQSLHTWNEMMILRDNTLKQLYASAAKKKEEGLDDLVTIDKMITDFPIDLFLMNDSSNYIVDKTKGKTGKVVSLADEDDI